MKKSHVLGHGITVLTVAGLCAAGLAGCNSSSDDSPSGWEGGTEGGRTDATAGDGSSSGPDGTIPDTGSSPESSTTKDTGSPDDTGAPEAGGDDGSEPGKDAGRDAGPDAAGDGSGDDAAGQHDASDAGGDDASDGAAEAGMDSGVSFNNPVQIDVSGIPFNANTVATTATGGVALTAMDGDGNGNDFPTQAKATALHAGGAGLPDDGHFASTGTTIPDVHLAWNDSANALNSVLVAGNAGTTYHFNVPPAHYDQLQIYATGGNGGSTLSYTLSYTTGSPSTATIAIPDWCVPGTLPSGEYTLVSVDRVTNDTSLDTSITCSIYAINLNPDATRTLTQVSFSDSGGSTSYLVFYGATAW